MYAGAEYSSELLRLVLRYVGAAMIGMGIYTRYCTIYYNPSYLSYSNSYSFPCYAGVGSTCYVSLPDSITPSNNYNYYNYSFADAMIGKWLFYAVGHTIVAAALNIAWGAITLNLIGVLTVKEAPVGESTALLSRNIAPSFLAPTFIVTGEAKQTVE